MQPKHTLIALFCAKFLCVQTVAAQTPDTLNFLFDDSPCIKRQLDISPDRFAPIVAVEGFGSAFLQFFQADGKRIGEVARSEFATQNALEEIKSLKWSPDGRYLAVQGYKSNNIHLYDRTGKHVQTWNTKMTVADPAVFFEWERDRVVTCRKDGMLRFWHPEAGKPTMDLQEGIVRAWNFNDPDAEPMSEIRVSWPSIPKDVRCFALSPDGYWALTGHGDGTVAVTPIVGNLPAGQRLFKTGFLGSIVDVAFSPDGQTIVAIPFIGSNVWIQSLSAGASAVTADLNQPGNGGVKFTPDGKYLISSGTAFTPGRAQMIDLQGRVVRQFSLAKASASDVAVSPDGRWAVFTVSGGNLQLFALDPALKKSDLSPAYPFEFNPKPQESGGVQVNNDYTVMMKAYPEPTDDEQRQDHIVLAEQARKSLVFDPSQANRRLLAQALNSLGWYELLTGHFQEAEAHCRESLEYDPESLYPHTNIPTALLFQGKYEAAQKLYLEWKDKPFPPGGDAMPTFKEAFLDDLKTFEKKGLVTDGNRIMVEKIRKILQR